MGRVAMSQQVGGAMATALERGREKYNARFAAARLGGASVDGDSFLVHLGNVVAPVIEAVAAVMPERVDGVLAALYDVSLELFSASLMGPRSKSAAVGDVWSQVLPVVPQLVLRDPKSVAAALSNAGYNIGRTNGARPCEWIEIVRRVGPRCENVAELLDVGMLAAWRAGMPHYRGGAIAAAKTLRAELVGGILDVPAGSAGAILDRMLADPWLTPSAATDSLQPAALRLVGVVGAFRGFGGEFVRPPTAFVAGGGSIFIADGDATFRLICDCFGRRLIRDDRPDRTDLPAGDIRVSPDGVVQWGAGRASFPPWAGDVSGFACDGHTIAVTLRTSHHVYLVARAAEENPRGG
jgi:hypothetical protein